MTDRVNRIRSEVLFKMLLIRSLNGLLVVAVLLLWAAAMAPTTAIAQQQYNNTLGYTCNGASKTCSTYALYRTSQAMETLDVIGGYFNKTATSISTISGLTALAPDALLREGQFLTIPLDCTCQNQTSQMLVPHTLAPGDSLRQLAAIVYGGLTTYQAITAFNPNLRSGDVIMVPIFCACPTAAQIADGVSYLLTRTVYPNDTLDRISEYFGITPAELSAANELPVDAILDENTTVVLPVSTLPTTIVSPPPRGTSEPGVGLIVGVSGGSFFAVFVLAMGIALFLRRRRAHNVESSDKEGLTVMARIPGFISYKHLSAATKQFGDQSKLGEGGFGSVYKGVLPKTGTMVAVKKVSNRSSQGEREFLAEVQIISQLRHRNVVELMGFCKHEGKCLLVYELLPKGSLDQALFKPQAPEYVLSWSQRWKIVSGIAAALHYLHEGWRQQVIHRDVKPSNIMLDDEYNPKLGDFGLARLVDHEYTASITNVAGTFGYIAPEATSGKFTDKTDVYAFGAVALEVACGRRALDANVTNRDDLVLVDLVWRRLEEGKLLSVADELLLGDFDADQMCNVLKLGLLCSHPNPSCRPSMREVVQVFAGDVDAPDVPCCKPELSLRSEMYEISIDSLLYSTSPSQISVDDLR